MRGHTRGSSQQHGGLIIISIIVVVGGPDDATSVKPIDHGLGTNRVDLVAASLAPVDPPPSLPAVAQPTTTIASS
ncbi:hypothetical protein Scep_000015 [Stephania cephalantha]|uniref:Uncharacterized protein n=1 Tax=Stephania cephalantha TaxID=152367 RepID=A0AAP0L8Z6_9MAGN